MPKVHGHKNYFFCNLHLESEQVTGSYKVRGAFNKMKLLCEQSDDTKVTGVTAASSGNFGIACVSSKFFLLDSGVSHNYPQVFIRF